MNLHDLFIKIFFRNFRFKIIIFYSSNKSTAILQSSVMRFQHSFKATFVLDNANINAAKGDFIVMSLNL